MGLPGRGHKGYIQFGREPTWGVGTPSTHRIPYVSCDTRPQGGFIRSEMMNLSRWRHGIYKGPKLYRVTVVLELWFEGMLQIIDLIQGTSTYGSNGGTTTGANPYVHTFLGKDILNSYSIEIIEGNIPSGKCQLLTGCKIDTATLAGASGFGSDGICRLTLNALAKSYDPDQDPTASLNPVTALPVLFHEISSVLDGTADATADKVLKSFEISWNNHLAERLSTSDSILEPVPEAVLDFTIKLQKEFQTKTLLAAYNAFTSGQPSIVFGNSASKRITVSIPGTANITEYNHPISGGGLIMQDVTWEAFRPNNVNGPVTVVVENTQATILT